ncbi:RNA polymerase-binding protein DksA [Rhodanobacter sp. C03]|nr:RNA polymerase-binding protein DksA [Rhodanobacter sp. C03]
MAKPAGKATAKPVAAKKPAAKPVAKKAVAKPQPKKASQVKKPAAKKAAVKKVAVKKPAPKKVAVKNAKVKSSAVSKKTAKPAAKPVARKAVAPVKPVLTHAAKAAAKPVHKPAAPAKVTAKPVAKPAPTPVHVVKSVSPAPASTLFKGKVASATAMVTPRAAPAASRHASPQKNQKNSSSSMNRLAAKNLDNGVTREDGRYALPATTNVTLPKGYHPSSNEEYMGPMHLAYFRNKLRDWRDQLVEESRQTMENLRDEVRDVGDEAERATRETENSLELRTRDRYRKLISKIDKALRRIEEGSYGYCEETDEEIGVDRLDARPIATLSLDAQERREHLQKQMGD